MFLKSVLLVFFFTFLRTPGWFLLLFIILCSYFVSSFGAETYFRLYVYYLLHYNQITIKCNNYRVYKFDPDVKPNQITAPTKK